jgi:hypothetical protein
MSDIPMFPFNPEQLKTQSVESDDVFFRRAVEMIDVGFNSGMDKITLFQVPDDDMELYLNLPDFNWVQTLEDALKHFEMVEDYEMCSYTKDVLERITG